MLAAMLLTDLKAEQAATWGSAPFERIAGLLAPMHDDLIARLAPRAGQQWLDVATGTGALALRAARAGAEVTGIDFAPPLIETAKRLAMEQHEPVCFEVGDAEELRYGDASFDIISSSCGAVFAPDHRAVARELARVCRPGGRIGLTAWRGGDELTALVDSFRAAEPTEAGDPDDWGRESHVRSLLDKDFELEFAEGDCPLVGPSGEAVWELVTASVGPMKALAESLEPERLELLRHQEVELLERHRVEGGVSYPQRYLLILGIRR
jgi:SAM-dependent methyltransferase